jgi:ribosome biogenesis protein UTP30
MDANLVERACVSLIRHSKQPKPTSSGKTDIFGDEAETIFMHVQLKKMPPHATNIPFPAVLPHGYVHDEGEVCLIVQDPQRFYKDHVEAWKLGSKITKVIGVDKLAKKFKTFEDRRKLCGSYALFLADARIIRRLPKLLGKVFISKKKMPVRVEIEDISKAKANLETAILTTHFDIGRGTLSAMRIGHSHQTPEQLRENIFAGLAAFTKQLTKGMATVQAVLIKTAGSVSLPIYNSVPEITVAVSTEAKKPTEKKTIPDIQPQAAASAEEGKTGKADGKKGKKRAITHESSSESESDEDDKVAKKKGGKKDVEVKLVPQVQPVDKKKRKALTQIEEIEESAKEAIIRKKAKVAKK